MGSEEKLRLALGADTNNMLAIKINIALKININNSSSANRREGTGDLKT